MALLGMRQDVRGGRVSKEINVVCHACGLRYGQRVPGLATIHEGRCDICSKYGPVTEVRDYGYLKDVPKPDSHKPVA